MTRAMVQDSPAAKLGTIRSLVKMTANRPMDYGDCLRFARLKFEKYFRHKLLQLLHNFPTDMKMNDGCTFAMHAWYHPLTASVAL